MAALQNCILVHHCSCSQQDTAVSWKLQWGSNSTDHQLLLLGLLLRVLLLLLGAVVLVAMQYATGMWQRQQHVGQPLQQSQ